jgi:hypothetical protein
MLCCTMEANFGSADTSSPLYAKAWVLYQNNQYEAAADALRAYERADKDWLLSNPTMKEQIDEAIID